MSLPKARWNVKSWSCPTPLYYTVQYSTVQVQFRDNAENNLLFFYEILLVRTAFNKYSHTLNKQKRVLARRSFTSRQHYSNLLEGQRNWSQDKSTPRKLLGRSKTQLAPIDETDKKLIWGQLHWIGTKRTIQNVHGPCPKKCCTVSRKDLTRRCT